MSADNRDQLRSPNGLIPAVLLVDGYVSGTWTVLGAAGEKEIHLKLFRPLSTSEKDDVERVRVGLLSFLQGETTL